MRKICNHEYWKNMKSALERNGDPRGSGNPCGKIFDDLYQNTICPHEELPISRETKNDR